VFVYVCFVICGCVYVWVFNVCFCVPVSGFCNVWVCVCVDFVMCGFVMCGCV